MKDDLLQAVFGGAADISQLPLIASETTSRQLSNSFPFPPSKASASHFCVTPSVPFPTAFLMAARAYMSSSEHVGAQLGTCFKQVPRLNATAELTVLKYAKLWKTTPIITIIVIIIIENEDL